LYLFAVGNNVLLEAFLDYTKNKSIGVITNVIFMRERATHFSHIPSIMRKLITYENMTNDRKVLANIVKNMLCDLSTIDQGLIMEIVAKIATM
jgi:hypothetical protein